MYHKITIQNRLFIIQAFKHGDFINLSPASFYGEKSSEKIGCLQFCLKRKKVFHDGKDSQFVKNFIEKIDFDKVVNDVSLQLSLNIKTI